MRKIRKKFFSFIMTGALGMNDEFAFFLNLFRVEVLCDVPANEFSLRKRSPTSSTVAKLSQLGEFFSFSYFHLINSTCMRIRRCKQIFLIFYTCDELFSKLITNLPWNFIKQHKKVFHPSDSFYFVSE